MNIYFIDFLSFYMRRNPVLISGNKVFIKLLFYYQGLKKCKHTCGISNITSN